MWKLAVVMSVAFLASCGTSQQFAAIPITIDTASVPHQTIEMKAQRYQFLPEEVHVKAGTLVSLNITALDGAHGFDLGAYGIDERLEKDEPTVITFYAGERGSYDFKCSHFCGIGHFGMNGRVIVE